MLKTGAAIISIILAFAANMSITAVAQETGPQNIAPTSPSINPSSSSAEQTIIHLLEVLDLVGVIIPGKGFKSFELGQTREQLVKLWGNPQQATRKVLQYQMDLKTVIQFHGKEAIKTIAIIGQTGSMARVENGVRFGMSPAQVIEFFDTKPDKENDKTVRYKNLGIEFFFKDLALLKIVVFAV